MNSATIISTLPIMALALPVAMLLACLFRPIRKLMPGWLWLAPLPALAAACLSAGSTPWIVDWAPYHLVIELDSTGAILLGTSALLWIAAGIFASEFFRGTLHREKFAISWLLTLIGSLGIFLAADLGLFLLFYALVSLPAYAMIIHDGTPSVRRAGSIYLGFALLGEGLLLLAFVLLAANAHGGSQRIVDVVTAMSTSPSRNVILPLLLVGFGMKMALLPMHFWMPLSYTAAPIPAAAVLSGAGVKAGVIGMIRFLPFMVALPEWGNVLVVAGLAGAFFGVAVGITQSNPKSVLAYSSVSQMGFLAALLGMGLKAGDVGVASVTAFYGAHHVLVKGALFLAIGVAGVTGKSRFPAFVLWPAALIALGLAGLPLTGGALAKLAAKNPLGYGIVGTLATWSAAGTALLMFHFLHCLSSMTHSEPGRRASLHLIGPWLGLVVAAVVVPWATFSLGGISSLGEVISPSALWKVLWPLLVGGLLAMALRRSGNKLPRVPTGDVAALGGGLSAVATALSKICQGAEDRLKQWPVAGLSLLVIAILLVMAMWK